MAAVGEDSEAALAGIGLLEHHLHAHAAHHVLAALDGEGDLHVLLVGLDAGLKDAAEGRNVSFDTPVTMATAPLAEVEKRNRNFGEISTVQVGVFLRPQLCPNLKRNGLVSV